MDFLAGPLLWGIAAAGVPLIIHLIGRAKPIPHVFPAVRFILRSQRTSSRALKLKHLLVLLMRIVALLLISMALARPLWNAGATPVIWSFCGVVLAALIALAVYQREILTAICGLLILAALITAYPDESSVKTAALNGDYVLVLDQSASMGYLESSGTRLELARTQALHFIDKLAPAARIALIVATENADRVQGRLSFRHSFVREKLLNAFPTGRGLDLAKSLQAAQEILARDHPSTSTDPAAIILFTDLQANALQALTLQKSASKSDNGAPRSPLIVVDVGSDQAKNGAAVSATLPGSILPSDSKSELLGVVRPVDKDHPCLIELYIDERRVAQKLVDPKGEEIVNVSLDFLTGAAGPHTGRLHLPDSDRLPVDQDFLFSYTAGRPASALILESPGSEGVKGSAFFLSAALQFGSDTGTSMGGLACEVRPPHELTLLELSKHRVVILADCGALSPSSWTALQQWTGDGGGLFVWLGPNTESTIARYGYQQHANFEGLLPGNIGAFTSLAKPQTLVVSQPDHPVLAHFTAGASSVLAEAQISRLVRITPETRDQNASVILSLADGTPVLLEKIYGRGRVLCAAIDPALACSDLPRRAEAYVTLALDAARLLSGEEGEMKARLGMPMLLTLPAMPADGQVLWKKPGAAVPVILRVDAIGRTEIKGAPSANLAAPVSAIVPILDVTGIHQFSWYPAGAALPISKFVAVNCDPTESKLTRASNDAALKALASWNPEIVQEVLDAQPLVASGGKRAANRELTTALLLMLLAIMLAESFLSNRMYRGEAEPEPQTSESLLERNKTEPVQDNVIEERPVHGG